MRRQGSQHASGPPSRLQRRSGSRWRPSSTRPRSRSSAPATTRPSGATSSPGGRSSPRRPAGDAGQPARHARCSAARRTPPWRRRAADGDAGRPGGGLRARGRPRRRGARRGRGRCPGAGRDHRRALRARCRRGARPEQEALRDRPGGRRRAGRAELHRHRRHRHRPPAQPRRAAGRATWPCSARAATWCSTSPRCSQTAAWASSRFVSLGNQADLTRGRPDARPASPTTGTRAVAIYAEDVVDGRAFVAAARALATPGKPVVLLAPGRSEAAVRERRRPTPAR